MPGATSYQVVHDRTSESRNSLVSKVLVLAAGCEHADLICSVLIELSELLIILIRQTHRLLITDSKQVLQTPTSALLHCCELICPRFGVDALMEVKQTQRLVVAKLSNPQNGRGETRDFATRVVEVYLRNLPRAREDSDLGRVVCSCVVEFV